MCRHAGKIRLVAIHSGTADDRLSKTVAVVELMVTIMAMRSPSFVLRDAMSEVS